MDQTMTKSNYFGGLWTLSCFTSSISLDLILYNCLPLSRERCLQWRWYQWYHISNTASLYQELKAHNLSPHWRLQFLQCNTVSLITFVLWDYELKKFLWHQCWPTTCSISHYSRPFQLIWVKIKPWRWSNQGGKRLTLIIFWLSFIMNNNLFMKNHFFFSKWLTGIAIPWSTDKWAGHGYILDLVSGNLIKMSEFYFENMLKEF